MITRRQFLIGLGSGLILPSFHDRALAYWENHGEALLEIPSVSKIELFAVASDPGFQLNLGDPWEQPPSMTHAQFADAYHDGWDRYLRWQFGNYQHIDPDKLPDRDTYVDPEFVAEHWCRGESANAKAYDLLKRYDLCPEGEAEKAGELLFIDGASPGNDYRGVHVPTAFDLALLQQRLNDLRTGIAIRFA